MSVLVTGGTGFIGLNIAEALAARGERVALYAADPPPPEIKDALTGLPGRVIAVEADIRDEAALERLVREAEVDRIVHAATVTSGPARERRDTRAVIEVNLMGTLAVLEVAQRHPIRRVVLLSSGAVYGPAAAISEPIVEDRVSPTPDSLYAITKFSAERVGARIKSLTGLDVVAARLGAAFGPWERDTGHRDTLSPPYQALVAALEGREVVLPRPGLRDWLYSRDAADGVIRLLDAPRLAHELYHISAGARWTVEDWCRRLASRHPGLKWRLSNDPAEQTVDLFAGFDRAPLSIARINDELGWRPRFDLDAAFADFMAWLDR